jgi:hypothetical protein
MVKVKKSLTNRKGQKKGAHDNKEIVYSTLAMSWEMWGVLSGVAIYHHHTRGELVMELLEKAYPQWVKIAREGFKIKGTQ